MDTNPNRPPTLSSLSLGPAELELLQPTVVRLSRIARVLFEARFVDTVLFDGDSLWRASAVDAYHREIPDHRAGGSATQDSIPDLLAVESLPVDIALPTAGPTGCCSAPIRLANGVHVGTLSTYCSGPAAASPERAGLLQDLADVLGYECDRVRAIGEQSALAAQLRRSEQRLRVAVENADLYVFEMDYRAKELIKIGNERAFFDEDQTYECCVQDPYGVILPEDRKAAEEVWERHVREGTPNTHEWRLNRPDKLVWVHNTSEVYYDEQKKPVCMIGSFQNITDRKLTELAMIEARAAAEDANRAKSTFLATMSHEIRTPLNGVLGMAQAMACDDLSAIQRERVDVIRRSGESLLAILNDMLDLSKIEAGKMDLEEIEFDLGEIARGAHATFTALANKKGLSFALDIDAAKGVYLGDPTRTRQILYNLISNSLKFTERGEIRVTAQYDGGGLTVSVSDTGIGMPAQVVAGLFNTFAQADSSTTRRFGGTGLGLAICKQLAELMGGSISVTSIEHEGSTFTFHAPLVRMGEARCCRTAEVTAAKATEIREVRVLAAEDNGVNQLVLKTLLLQIGVDPVIVENGKLALEAWEAEDWDVVLMDIQMPVMDGITAARSIRAREAATGRVQTPIIALTANAMSHQIAQYRAAGMDGLVAKPIEAQKLLQALETALDGRSGEESERTA